jgi:uncharacterized membrane protein
MAFHEKHSRSIVKAITYRLLIIVSDSVIVYVITRRLDVAAGFIAVNTVVNTALYFLHERAWNSIHWGKAPLIK